MKVSLNNVKYKVEKTDETQFDSYYNNGILFDELDAGLKIVGSFTCEDGTTVGVSKRIFNLPLTLFVAALALVALVLVIFTTVIYKSSEGGSTINTDIRPIHVSEDTVGDDTAKVNQVVTDDTDKELILNYKRYVTYSENQIDITYVNVNTPATVKVIADTVESESKEVAANETVNYLNITVDGDDFPKSAYLLVTINKETYRCPIVIQLPSEMDVVGASESKTEDDYFNPSTFKDMEDVIND